MFWVEEKQSVCEEFLIREIEQKTMWYKLDPVLIEKRIILNIYIVSRHLQSNIDSKFYEYLIFDIKSCMDLSFTCISTGKIIQRGSMFLSDVFILQSNY